MAWAWFILSAGLFPPHRQKGLKSRNNAGLSCFTLGAVFVILVFFSGPLDSHETPCRIFDCPSLVRRCASKMDLPNGTKISSNCVSVLFFSVKVLSALIHDDSGHFNNVSKGNKSQTRPFTNVFSLLQDDGVVQKKNFLYNLWWFSSTRCSKWY